MKKVVMLIIVLLANLVFSDVMLTEDFESGGFTYNSWTNSDVPAWSVVDDVFHNGNHSACSGDIDNNQKSEISINIPEAVKAQKGTKTDINFYYKISSEENWDFLNFYINEEPIAQFSGEIDWTLFEYSFYTTGSHVLRFEYTKDSDVSLGSDCVWIDDIIVESSIFVDPPAFSLDAGYYPNSMNLELNSTYDDATIYYTDNGSVPDNSSGLNYSASGIPFSNYSGIVTIKAVTYTVNGDASAVVSRDYNFSNELSGSVAGVLSKDKSPYYVNSDITIPNLSTLTIDPGDSLLFTGFYGLYVNGRLNANGNETDKIIFTVDSLNEEIFYGDDEEGGWGGIIFNGSSDINEMSIINNCVISYAKNFYYGYGGGVYINNVSKLSITNSTITNNRADYGGGIYLSGSSPIIRGNTISSNNGYSGGGGLYITGSSNPVIEDNNLSFNYGYGNGGGIFISSNSAPIITGNIIKFNDLNVYTVKNSGLSKESYGSGGGIFSLTSSPIIINNVISNNNAWFGTGLFCNDSEVDIFNNLISDNFITNTVYEPTGSVVLYNSSGDIINNTIVNNDRFINLDGNNGLVFKNNIIHKNNADSYQFALANGDNSGFYNCLIQNGLSSFDGSFIGIYSNCLNADPAISTELPYQLTAVSPCVNTGDRSVINLENFPLKDIIGNDRIFDEEGNSTIVDNDIDIGAYEFNGISLNVATPQFSHQSGTYFNTQFVEITCATSDAEIRYTTDGTDPSINFLVYVNGNPLIINKGVTIKAIAYKSGITQSLIASIDLQIINSGEVSGRWLKTASPIKVEGDIEIPAGKKLEIEPGVEVIFYGNYQLKVSGQIKATGTPLDRITFTINDSTGFGNNTTNSGGWRGINFINSITDSNRIEFCNFEYGKKMVDVWPVVDGYENGGLIYSKDSKVNIENCSFQNGKAKVGGAVYISNSDVNIKGCLFSNNFAESYGIISMVGSESVIITNCTIANNAQILSFNSGIVSMISSSNTDISNTIFYNNIVTDGFSSLTNVYIGNNSNCNISYCLIDGGVSSVQKDTSPFSTGNITAIKVLDADPRFSIDLVTPYSLLASSPCANMGDNSVEGLPIFDLAGNPRIYENTIDLGAYELQTTAFTNPVLTLSETEKFTFDESNLFRLLEISNQGNAPLNITFSLLGLSNSFTISKYLEGSKINKSNEVSFTLNKHEKDTLEIDYVTDEPTVSKFDILNYTSNAIENNTDKIELFGGQIIYPDVIIDSISVPSSGWFTGLPTRVSWKVENIGDATADTKWKDKVSLVRIDIDTKTPIVTKYIDYVQYLTPWNYYTNETFLDVPTEIDLYQDTYYIVEFVANADKVLIGDNPENNTKSSDPFKIDRSPGADLIVDSLFIINATTNIVGTAEKIEIGWTVKNTGTGNPNAGTWYDTVYLSPDSLDVNKNPILGKFEIEPPVAGLPPDSSYTKTATVTIPHFANLGVGHIYIVTDSNNSIYENAAATGEMYNISVPPLEIEVIFSGLPNLTSQISRSGTASDIVFTGNQVSINCKVNNVIDNMPPFDSVCKDRIYLSEQIPDPVVEFDPLDAYTLYTNTKYGIDTLLVLSENVTEASYSFLRNIVIPLNTGIDADSAYFESYLFSNPEISKNTLKYFGYEDVKDEEIPEIVSILKSKAVSSNASLKNASKLEQDPRDYFLYMSTDYDNKVYEGTVESNEEKDNISNIPITLKISPWADLKVNAVTLDKTELMPGDYLSVTWEIINQGDTTAFADWTDKVYISPESKWDKDRSKLLGQTVIAVNLDTLKNGNTYKKTILYKIPLDILSGGDAFSESFIHIYTDAMNNVYERTDESNNMSEDISVILNIGMPSSDLVAKSLSSTDSVHSGGTLTAY